MRGTTIIKDLHITQIDRIPSGRVIVAEFHGTCLINVYAPSGTSKRTQMECFCFTELPALQSADSHSILLGGDFNFILHPANSTGPPTPTELSKRPSADWLSRTIWNRDPNVQYIHAMPHRCTKIDRIHLSKADINRKTGIEIIPTDFTEHHAAVLRRTIPAHVARKTRGPGKWTPYSHKTTSSEAS
jgi:hypothetical protein